MGWNHSKYEALLEFFKFYRDHPDGYSAKSIGRNCAEFHEILSNHEFDKERRQ